MAVAVIMPLLTGNWEHLAEYLPLMCQAPLANIH